MRIEDRKTLVSILLCVLCGSAVFLTGCNRSTTPTKQNRVVLYCSVDDVYAQPIIRELEKTTGLRIDALYDTEATKTAGLAYRIRAERNRPRGDVFWSSALLQTLLLKREGLLQPYQSPSASDIPTAFKDPAGAWTGLGARARVVISHTTATRVPQSAQALARLQQIGISNPQFGTGSDWVAALATRWGVAKTLNYFRSLKKNSVRVLPGNSVVADKVARGELLYGMTDTDDYIAQKAKTGGILAHLSPKDTVLVSGSVAMLKGAPHPEAARKLMDALLSKTTEQQLALRMKGVVPLRGQSIPIELQEMKSLIALARQTPNDTNRWPAAWDAIRDPLAEILLTD